MIELLLTCLTCGTDRCFRCPQCDTPTCYACLILTSKIHIHKLNLNPKRTKEGYWNPCIATLVE